MFRDRKGPCSGRGFFSDGRFPEDRITADGARCLLPFFKCGSTPYAALRTHRSPLPPQGLTISAYQPDIAQVRNARRQSPPRAEGIQGTAHKKRKCPTDLVKPPPLRISHCPSFLFPDRSPLHDIQPDAGDGLAEHVRHMRVASEVQKLMPRRTFLRRSQIAEGLSRTQGAIGIKLANTSSMMTGNAAACAAWLRICASRRAR